VDLGFDKPVSLDQVALQVRQSANDLAVSDTKIADASGMSTLKSARLDPLDEQQAGRFKRMRMELVDAIDADLLGRVISEVQKTFANSPVPERLENFDSTLAQSTPQRALYAIVASWLSIVIFLWFRFGNWTFGLAALLCLIHDLFFTLGVIAFCHYFAELIPGLAGIFLIQDFKIDLPAVAALLTLVGYSVNDTIVVFDRIREVRGRNPGLSEELINKSINQTLSRTIWTSFTIFLVVVVLYLFGGEGVHLFAFIMVMGVIVGTYSSIFVASPLLLILGEGRQPAGIPGSTTGITPQKA
jgi:SecD/SecF fusion protein